MAIWYAAPAATGSGSGLDENNAATLAGAAALASAADDIYCDVGTYSGILVPGGVSVYGGFDFAAFVADPALRDLDANVSLIDLGPNPGFTFSGTGSVVDGFTAQRSSSATINLLYLDGSQSATGRNLKLIGGVTDGYSSEFQIRGSAALALENCQATDAYSGGAVYCSDTASLIAKHCSFTPSRFGGFTVRVRSSAVGTFENCIFSGQATGMLELVTGTIEYSIIPGGFAGTGNVDADPLYVDSANGDFELQPGSPAIGAANPATALSTDRLLHTRDGSPDMGPLEFQSAGGGDLDPVTASGSGVGTGSAAALRLRAVEATGVGTGAAGTVLARDRRVDASGVGVGTSLASAVRARSVEAAGLSTGGSAVGAILQRRVDGSGAGVGTSTRSVTRVRRSIASGAGLAASSRAASRQRRVNASGFGVGTSSVSLVGSTGAVEASGSGVGTSSASIARIRSVAASAAGIGTSSASVVRARRITASASGIAASSVAATRERHVGAFGFGAGTSTVSLVPEQGAVAASGSGIGVGSASAARIRRAEALGAGTGSGSASAVRERNVDAAASSIGVSVAGAFVRRLVAASGTGAGTSAMSITRERGVAVSGAGHGASSRAASRERRISASGFGVGTSSVSLVTGLELMPPQPGDGAPIVDMSPDSTLMDYSTDNLLIDWSQ